VAVQHEDDIDWAYREMGVVINHCTIPYIRFTTGDFKIKAEKNSKETGALLIGYI